MVRYVAIMKKKSSPKRTKKTPTRKVARKSTEQFVSSTMDEFSMPEPVTPPSYEVPTVSSPSRVPSTRILSLGILIVALVLLFATNKGFFLAAFVNGQPVFRWTLNNVLTKRYGQQTLEGIITEKLISDEAQKQKVAISAQDIDAREKDILASFGSSMTVDDFLKLQGINKADFENQLKLQLMVTRLLTKDLTITDDDITNYIASNHATLVATDPAKLKEEAKQAIIDAKVGEKIDAFLQDLRSKASISKFL